MWRILSVLEISLENIYRTAYMTKDFSYLRPLVSSITIQWLSTIALGISFQNATPTMWGQTCCCFSCSLCCNVAGLSTMFLVSDSNMKLDYVKEKTASGVFLGSTSYVLSFKTKMHSVDFNVMILLRLF